MSYLFSILPVASALLCVCLGLFTLKKNPRHAANVGFMAGLLCLALVEAGSFLVLAPGMGLAASGMELVFAGQALLPSAWLLFTSIFGRGNYRDLSRNQIYLCLGTAAASIVFCVLIFTPSLSSHFLAASGALPEAPAIFALGPAGKYLYIFVTIGMVVNLVQLETTLRSSTGSNRWRIKYIILGIGSILAFYIYMSSQSLLFSSVDTRLLPVRSAVVIVATSMMAVFIARHRLLDVDIFVSRYFVYNSVTVLVAGLYLLAVGLVTQGIRYFELPYGSFFSTIFVFISVLSLAVLLFATAIRRKVQLFINRNFYKHKYEFRDKWMETVEKITPRRSVREVCDTFIDIISETMLPSAVHLWTVDPASREFAHAGKGAAPAGLQKIPLENPFIDLVRERLSPFSVEDVAGRAGSELFASTDTVLCSPLVAGGDVVGFLLLGPDRSGARYIQDDDELLKAVSTQAAIQMKEIRLFEELTEAKEIEAFSKMSSFIMHDLKNLTNSLSLVSQNAQHNMDNPEFQRDIIRTIDGTVSRMKKVIERLSNVPHGLALKKQVVDAGELVEKSLQKLALPAGKEVVLNTNIEACPAVLVDPEAFEMIILNLILNAYEALPASGVISLRAYPDRDFVFLSVDDNGRGMTGEYIESCLFRPFKSTKKNGLGIGLYQCKHIIEAHGGSIEVKSSPGTGTSFLIRLPAYFEENRG